MGCLERKVLKHIYKGVLENGSWGRHYNFKVYNIYKEPEIVKAIRINRLKWKDRMDETQPVKQILHQTPVGSRPTGRP